jgi:2-enoate reductase
LKMQPDVLLLATGAKPIIPSIPGITSNKVITAVDLLAGKYKAGKRTVIIGGGLVGCETALHIAELSKELTVVEMLDNLMEDEFHAIRMSMVRRLSEAKIKILTGTRVLEITKEGVIVDSKSTGRNTMTADTVVIAVGMKSNIELQNALGDQISDVRVIGDCVEPRRVVNAIWEGFRTARLI